MKRFRVIISKLERDWAMPYVWLAQSEGRTAPERIQGLYIVIWRVKTLVSPTLLLYSKHSLHCTSYLGYLLQISSLLVVLVVAYNNWRCCRGSAKSRSHWCEFKHRNEFASSRNDISVSSPWCPLWLMWVSYIYLKDIQNVFHNLNAQRATYLVTLNSPFYNYLCFANMSIGKITFDSDMTSTNYPW